MIYVIPGLTRNLDSGQARMTSWMPDRVRHDKLAGFTLVELMISISIIAILTAAAIPSFTSFSNSQTLNQNVKTLKSDLRIAQSRSISGSTVGGNAKAWGIYFSTATNNQYIIFVCSPAQNINDYTKYLHGNALQCPNPPPDVKTVNLGSQVKISSLSPNDGSGNLSVVFDAQNGTTYANGSQTGATINLSYTDGSGSPLPVTITAGGGISD